MTERNVPALAGSETDAGAPPAGTASRSTTSARASAVRDGAREAVGLPAIELSGVVKEFQARGEVITAVAGIDLDIREGEFFSLLGPSGCGKTTTMRMIAGFEEPTQGVIRLHGQDVTNVPPNKRDVNMVFQSYALFPHMNVFENVAFGLRRKAVQARDHPPGRRDARHRGPGRAQRAAPGGAVRRSAAAGGARPGTRQQPPGAAARRAAGRA